MSPVELIALSLGLSIAVAAVGGGAAAALERVSGDATLRDRAWAAALYLPALPPLTVALMLLTPAPVVTVAEMPVRALEAPLIDVGPAIAPVAPAFSVDGGLVALIVLALAGLLIAARLISLTRRAARLNRLIAQAGPASPETEAAVAATARSLGIAAPAVRATASGPDALLAGLIRPVLILPAALAETPDAPATRAVVTHELAHLKRGDHRAVWIEEALMAALAVNPLLPLIRARRAAAREEACDRLALAGADPSARRAYAQSLIEALRARADTASTPMPALTFTGFQRSQAMRRLKSILTPPATAGRGTRIAAAVAGVALLGLAGAGSVAVAAHRQPQAAMPGEADASPALNDHAYLDAAMAPIFKAAWPGACGFGSDGADGLVFVHAGDGCPTLAGPRILIRTLAGVSPSADPRAAFAAVKAACDSGRPVEIAFSQGDGRGTKTAVCAAPAIAPPEPVRFTVDLTYDPAIAIAAGDTLEIALKRNTADGGTASTGMVLDLAPGAMPGLAFADLRPPLLPSDRSGPMFAMSAKIVGADGALKAISDREAGRPFAPYVIGRESIKTQMRMLPIGPASTRGGNPSPVVQPLSGLAAPQASTDPTGQRAAREAAVAAMRAAQARRTPEQRARYSNPTAMDLKRFCGGDDMDLAYCDGVLFGNADRLDGVRPGACMPTDAEGGLDVLIVSARGRRAVAAATPLSGQDANAFVRATLRQTFSCPEPA